ncbi:uncharacterized protein LOC125679423 isoform X2 [Ostrea edulis]|uniref:uncharacterized protein LOC125679423 isoform X2 n=1 Tax=Ostrea edulis TaxID=37623 RepID=UPI0020947EA2|nr:uncharacterized protein LOC125679423 isoform X2 [Ostrea edulis]
MTMSAYMHVHVQWKVNFIFYVCKLEAGVLGNMQFDDGSKARISPIVNNCSARSIFEERCSSRESGTFVKDANTFIKEKFVVEHTKFKTAVLPRCTQRNRFHSWKH